LYTNNDKHSQSDHDLLIKLNEDIRWLKEQISNHLAHHIKYEVALIVAIIMLVVERFVN
jgi:hypothetical protein